MRKIPTLFRRDPHDLARVTADVTPGCEWVLRGEGVPRRKYDGTCVLFDKTLWWARRVVRRGTAYPPGFLLVEFDSVTGKSFGWEPVVFSSFRKAHVEALRQAEGPWAAGTYELCGPKVNGNPEGYDHHRLIAHNAAEVLQAPATLAYASLREWLLELKARGIEGVVWHHQDRRMAKLKGMDFA